MRQRFSGPGPVPVPVPVPVLLFLLHAGAAVARADEIRMKDGRLLEGKVLEEGPAEVKFRLRFGGDLTLRRDEVQSIERKDLPEERIAKKRAALDAKDAEGLWRLALEAKDLKLRKAYEAFVEEVLLADPTHAGANEAKGRVLHEGTWMTPAERDRMVAERERKEQEAKGLVPYKDRWVTPEEKEALEKGLVKYEGRWMTEREAKEAQGFVLYKGAWVRKEDVEATGIRDTLVEAAGVPLTVALSERFSVATVYSQADTNLVLQDCEKTYAEFARAFGVLPADRLFDDPFSGREEAKAAGVEGSGVKWKPKACRCTIVILEKQAQYDKFLDGLLKYHTDLRKILPAERVALMRSQKGFYLTDPDCWVVGYQFPYPKEQTRHTVVHKLSHVLLQRWHNKGSAWTRWWLLEGLGEYQEVNAFGSCLVFCITADYGDPNAGSGKAIGEAWKAETKKLVVTGGDSKLRDLATKGLNELQPYDLVKSWSLVHYLLSLDREKFAALVLQLKEKIPLPEALDKVYGATPEEIDARWRDFVKKTY